MIIKTSTGAMVAGALARDPEIKETRSGNQFLSMSVKAHSVKDDSGKWNSVFRRYRRWVTTGVFEAMLETLGEMVARDATADMIDSTVVRAHHCAVGIKKGLRKPRRLADREADSAQSSTPAAMPKADRSALS